MQTGFEIVLNGRTVVGTCDYSTRRVDESFDHAFGTENCYSEEVDDVSDIDAYVYIGDGEEVPYTGDMEG